MEVRDNGNLEKMLTYDCRFIAWNTSNTIQQATATGGTINTWTAYAGVFDGSNITAYLDGVAGTPTSLTGTLKQGTTDCFIGTRNGSLEDFNGRISETRISKIARSDAWIKATAHVFKGTIFK
jgi:hypothetical protein